MGIHVNGWVVGEWIWQLKSSWKLTYTPWHVDRLTARGREDGAADAAEPHAGHAEPHQEHEPAVSSEEKDVEGHGGGIGWPSSCIPD